jgi:hypothetical protein
MSVDTFYTQNSVVQFKKHPAHSFATITMQKVKFAEQMPQMDITIDSIIVADIPHGIVLAGNNIVSEAMGGAYPEYIIKDLIGLVTADSLSFSMTFGTYPLTYEGKLMVNGK